MNINFLYKYFYMIVEPSSGHLQKKLGLIILFSYCQILRGPRKDSPLLIPGIEFGVVVGYSERGYSHGIETFSHGKGKFSPHYKSLFPQCSRHCPAVISERTRACETPKIIFHSIHLKPWYFTQMKNLAIDKEQVLVPRREWYHHCDLIIKCVGVPTLDQLVLLRMLCFRS